MVLIFPQIPDSKHHLLSQRDNTTGVLQACKRFLHGSVPQGEKKLLKSYFQIGKLFQAFAVPFPNSVRNSKARALCSSFQLSLKAMGVKECWDERSFQQNSVFQNWCVEIVESKNHRITKS